MKHLVLMLLVGWLAACSAPAADDHHQTPDVAHDHGSAHAHDVEETHSTVIAADTAHASGIRVAAAGPGMIVDTHRVQGLLTPVAGKVATASARFPGLLRELEVEVGDRVEAGQVLARVESNLSLSRYAVTAPIGGIVMARPVALGATVGQGEVLYRIADLSRLWVDLHIYGAEAPHVAAGAAVTVTRLADGVSRESRIVRVLPGVASASQSRIARAVVDNDDGRWRPGMAVSASIVAAERQAALVVPLTAVQRMDGQSVVFVRDGERYTAHPVTLGARDGERVEVLDGIVAGDRIVVAESYLIKADILKEGAAHVH